MGQKRDNDACVSLCVSVPVCGGWGVGKGALGERGVGGREGRETVGRGRGRGWGEGDRTVSQPTKSACSPGDQEITC